MKGEIMIQITATVESKEQAKALLEAGVDTLYAGGSVYGLRLPQSFTLEELKELVELTKEYDAKLVVPLNAIMHPEKMSHILSYMENLVEIGVEEVEVGDVGVIHLIRKNELPLKFIYNAQMIVTNARQINFWARKGAVKAVLGREVPYLEMKSLVKASTIPVEVLVYGATCIHQSLRPLVRNYENFIGVQGDTSKEANLFLAEPRKGGTHYSIYEDEHGTHIFADNDLNLMLKLKELYEKSIIFDKGGWNELRAIKSVLNKDRSKNNQVSLESMYTVEANMGLFEDMDGKELIPYYEKGYFGDIIDSKIIGGSYEQVTYGGDYTNKKEYKEFRKEVMKEALIDNLMHEDNFFSSIKKYYSDIENKSIKEDERERLNYEFKDEFGVSYKEYMDNKKNEDKVKEDIKNELEKLGRGENKMINKKEEKEILKMVREHEEWLNSRGERGKRLNLEGEDLKGIKFLNLDLRNANFKNADISNCIIYADLKNANFEGVKINEKTKFTGSKNINKMTIEANKLQIIDVQIKEELDKHKIGMKNIKSLKNKDNDIER